MLVVYYYVYVTVIQVLRENIKYSVFVFFFDYFRAGFKKWIWSKIRVDFTQHRTVIVLYPQYSSRKASSRQQAAGIKNQKIALKFQKFQKSH
jgi:hypothetical protein